MKLKKNWFEKLLNNAEIPTTTFIRDNFKDSRFVVLKQESKEGFIYREIEFILGPYIICSASNKIKENDVAKEWAKKSAHIPFGEFFNQKKLKRELIEPGDNFRKYKASGEIESEITETFYPLKNISISVFCGKVKNNERDIQIAKSFLNKHQSDFYMFPETYPYSRMEIKHEDMVNNTLYGGYQDHKPLTFIKFNNEFKVITKKTAFADEKLIEKQDQNLDIHSIDDKKISTLVCYDLLNPKISYELSKREFDFILVPAMIPKKDVEKWEKFIYTRGQELEAPIVLASNEDKRKICESIVIYYDPIKESVITSKKPIKLTFNTTNKKMIESPVVHWSWLLKNKVYGPFKKDFD